MKSITNMYFLFACSVQKEPVLPKYRCLWNWNPMELKPWKSTSSRKINLQIMQYPLVEFIFQKSFYSQWSFNIPAHQSVVDSKHMGHGLKQKLKLKLKLKQCHGLHCHNAMNEERWQIMHAKIMCYIRSLSLQLSNFHKHHAIALVALATGRTCPAHTFLHQTHEWIKYKFVNQQWFLLHSFDKLLRTTNQKIAFHFHSKVKVPPFI